MAKMKDLSNHALTQSENVNKAFENGDDEIEGSTDPQHSSK